MGGLRRAKTRQAKSRAKRLGEGTAVKAREEGLGEAVKGIIKIVVILRDTLGVIDQLIANLEVEFGKLPEMEKDGEAAHYLERLSDLKKERQRVSKQLDVQLDALMEMQAELDGLVGIGEAYLRLTERKEKT
jgi:vacuolar-type H+-ATPase subunit I/STV1